MCGGYYEEEMEDKLSSLRDEGAAIEDSKYYGPSTQFSSTPRFGRAAAVCELENIECRLDPFENTIHFKNAKAEEQFMIAWGKIVAGSLS